MSRRNGSRRRGILAPAKSRPAGKRAFTLIELLVVIAIIALLVSILMPSLQSAQTFAGLAACQVQMRNVAIAWHQYANDWNDMLVWTASAGNLETYNCLGQPTLPDGSKGPRSPSGFGLLFAERYVEDARHFYCPGCRPWNRGGWGNRPVAAHDDFRDRFEYFLVDRQLGYLRVDYAHGYWVDPKNGTKPSEINPNHPNGGPPTLNNYMKANEALFADSSDWLWPRIYHASSHADWSFQNVARCDGAVVTISDVKERGDWLDDFSHNYERYENTRPYWGWWRYFGTGNELH